MHHLQKAFFFMNLLFVPSSPTLFSRTPFSESSEAHLIQEAAQR